MINNAPSKPCQRVIHIFFATSDTIEAEALRYRTAGMGAVIVPFRTISDDNFVTSPYQPETNKQPLTLLCAFAQGAFKINIRRIFRVWEGCES